MCHDFFAWRDLVRKKVNGRIGEDLTSLNVQFILPFPNSYSEKKRNELLDEPHRLKPDIDNLVKALMDCLFKEDCQVSHLQANKTWDDGQGPRTIIYL